MNFAFLEKVEPRILWLTMASLIGLLLLASYLYLFKMPLRELDQLQRARILLMAKVEGGAQLDIELLKNQQMLADLRSRLQGESPLLPVSEMVAHTVDTLDRISSHHAVKLLSIKPGAVNSVTMFEEIPFTINVSGDYQPLFQWLAEVERELGPMVVKEFHMNQSSSPKDLAMSLDIVSYRPLGLKQ